MWLREHIGSCDGHLGVNENFRRTLKGGTTEEKARNERMDHAGRELDDAAGME